MGDWFQTVVATDVHMELAEIVRQTALNFLVSKGIIVPEISDSIIGEGEGHRPGPCHSAAVATSDPFISLATNGVVVNTGRIVALDPQGDNVWYCAACRAKNTFNESLSEAISAWYEGADSALTICSTCSRSTPLLQLATEPRMSFGHLAITFWNWPPLKPEFLQELGSRLESSVVIVSGKL